MIDPQGPSLRELGARELAGYRVLRSLARDQHAEVLLGHRITDGVVQSVAIKVADSTEPGWDAALRTCAALERARGEHVVDLLDLDADDESIRLIYERLPRGDLAELLRIRRSLEAGEAVTVLAPIAATLLRMHLAGVAHGRVSAGTVLFRDDGSPTLIGFSHAELFEAAAPEVVLERVEAVCRDRADARSLALEVLGRVEGARAHAVRELMADLEGCDDELVLPLLTSRLFETAAARPVRFEVDEQEAEIAPSNWRPIPVAEGGGERGGGVAGGVGGELDGDPHPGASAVHSSPWVTALGRIVPEGVLQRVLGAAARSPAAPVLTAVATAVSGHWGSWTSGRRRIVVAVVAAAATVGVVTAVVPAGAVGTGAAGTRAAGAAAPSSGAQEPRSASSAPVADDHASGEPSADDSAFDDPVRAAASLLRARDRCLSALSLRCLDQVDEPGSGAAHDDQAAIRGAQQGGELPDPPVGADGDGPPVLIERLGDSALVRLGETSSSASLLLVKVDGAWRIRDVIDAGATPAAQPDSSG